MNCYRYFIKNVRTLVAAGMKRYNTGDITNNIVGNTVFFAKGGCPWLYA